MLHQALVDCKASLDTQAMLDKDLTSTKLARALAVGFMTWLDRQADVNGATTKAEFARQVQALSGRPCSPQTVASWFKTGRMDKFWLPFVEEVLGVSLGFGRAVQLPLAAVPGKGYPDIPGVAHDLSQARNTESLPRVRWEELMSADLSQPFELEVVDDALAPEIFQGCIALLDPARPPEPAWPVLVRDRDGNHYLRDYEAGAGGRWSAVARARGYSALESESHGLTIVAAMDGYKRPRPLIRE